MAVIVALIITYINIRGVKTAAILQTILTVVIGAVGILLIVASAIKGTPANLEGQIFSSDAGVVRSVFKVALLTPFFFIGFDVIPQAAEEINVDLKKIGKILILSIVLAEVFYALVIIGVGYVMPVSEIAASIAGSGLVTADAMAKACTHGQARQKRGGLKLYLNGCSIREKRGSGRNTARYDAEATKKPY